MTPLDAVLAREFPERAVEGVRPARRGNSKRTLFVTFVDGGCVVIYLSSDVRGLHTEMHLARTIAARTTVPTPEVLAVGTVSRDEASEQTETPHHESAGDVGYAVVTCASGDDLHERFTSLDGDARRRVVATFGRVLAELHEAFTFDAYGDVSVRTDDAERPMTDVTDRIHLAATGPTAWDRWFEAYVEAGVEALPAAFAEFVPRIRAAVERADLPVDPPSRLFPWDLRPGNALVDDRSVTAFLDWGTPLAADPGLAVAKVEHLVANWYVDDGGELRAAFRTGYARRTPYPTVHPLYRVAAVVRSAVDSRGEVTRPGYPERTGDDARSFHVERLDAALHGK